MTGHLRKQSFASNANSSSSAFVMSKSSMTATHGTEKGVVIRNEDPKAAEGCRRRRIAARIDSTREEDWKVDTSIMASFLSGLQVLGLLLFCFDGGQ